MKLPFVLTPFSKRVLLVTTSALFTTVLPALFPGRADIIEPLRSIAFLLLGIAIPGPDTSHTVTVQASPALPASGVSFSVFPPPSADLPVVVANSSPETK